MALDAERASGFRYGGRAYLVQLRREDLGTALLDTAALPDLSVLSPGLDRSEWVLHAASQDLPCLAELGLRPQRLFDTELAGRLAGLPRVGLGPMVESLLGLGLAKGHGAADWSRRPLPSSWLTYAALDVEVLVKLRDLLAGMLVEQGKWEWAQQEFHALVQAPEPEPRSDPWRRTSGIHRLRDRRQLAVVRELWMARDAIARARDVAPHRVLPDSAIVAACAVADKNALAELPIFSGRMQRRRLDDWWGAVRRARALPVAELPSSTPPQDGPPPPGRWAAKDPEAAARLTAFRTAATALSEELTIPVENLLTPDLGRRVLWQPLPEGDVRGFLTAGGARPWQIDLMAPLLEQALRT